MAVPASTPQSLERLGCFKDVLRPFTVVMVPFPKKEVNLLWKGYFIIPYMSKLNDLHGRPMVNITSGATFYVYDKASTTSSKSSGWLSLSTIHDRGRNRSPSVPRGKQILYAQRQHVHKQDYRLTGAQAHCCW
jgi:hypothetical protein